MTGLINLKYFRLENNQLSGGIPEEIGNLTDLRDLYLSSNQLTGVIPASIGNLFNLTRLYLNINQLSGEIPESICNIFPNLGNNFYIQNNQFCPPYPECIEDYVGEQDTSNCGN